MLHQKLAQLLLPVRPAGGIAEGDSVVAGARPDEGHRDAGSAGGGAPNDQKESGNGGAGQLHASVRRGEDRGRDPHGRQLRAAGQEAGGSHPFGRAVCRFAATE